MSSVGAPVTPERAARITRRGYEAHKRGDLVAAVRLYQSVLAKRPDFPDALHHSALAARQLHQLGKGRGVEGAGLEESSRLMLAAMEAATEIAQAAAEADMAAYVAEDGALAAVRKLYAAMMHNYAWFQKDRGIIDGARTLYEAVTQMDPDLGEAWVNLGHVYGELGIRLRAEACWLRALECSTPSPEAMYNLAFVKLMRGDYLNGWAEYEARWHSPVFLAGYGRPDLEAPRWNGEPLDGTLYLHGEQGAGDVIMMARYIPIIETGVRTVIVEVLPALVRLFQQTFPHLHIVARGDTPPAFDAQLPMMSLPAVMGTLLETVPAPAPFASFEVEKPEAGRIGLCWKGSPTHPNDRVRSMPFEAVAPLLDVPGVTWQSLQWGEDVAPPLKPLGRGDFLDTARAVTRCDLVITVDTSIAHLAGSLGVRTWILLPPSAEWRWLQDREDSPWYPNARLFRARMPEWSWLVGQVATALRARFA